MNANTRDALVTLVLGAGGVALSLWVLHLLDLDAAIVALLQAIESADEVGLLAFALLTVVLVPLLAPTVLLTLGAGALYGVIGGTLLIVTAEAIGAWLAFRLGRRWLARRSRGWLKRHPRVAAPIESLQRDDWQSIALLRMIPFFPFKLSNYALGLTPVSDRALLVGTWIGLVPIALFNTRLGALAGDVLSLTEAGAGAPEQGLAWNGIALVFTAIVCVVAARRAAQLLARHEADVMTDAVQETPR